MQNQTDQIKERIDIVELLQEYIKLTPAGVGSFKALCPFHNEKTPSFVVSKDKQIWHCFGCGEGGDIFSWVQKMEGLDFPEALRILAKRANIKLDWQQPEISNAKTKLYDVCREAAEYWHELLLKDEAAKSIRDYLKDRGVQAETILDWQLGWSRESWDDLINHLKNKGYNNEHIFDAGLSVKSDKSKANYDRFRNRLMFPITNSHGHIVGFTGRTMSNEAAKYVNTPQTLIYNKSNILYGLDKAKTFIRKQDYTILVEGNMDVIAVSQAGTKNVAGVSGTALTLEQINILKRYSKNVMISFDADSAGQKAALRGLDLAWQEGLNVKIIKLKAGKDPDECIKKDKSLWLSSIKEATGIMDYYFEIVVKDLDMKRSDHKKKAASELLTVIAKLPDAIDRTHYLQKLSELINVSVNILEDKINSLRTNKTAIKYIREEGQAKQITPNVVGPLQMLSQRIIAVLINSPALIKNIIEILLPEDFKSAEHQSIYKTLVINYNNKDFDSNSVAALFKDNQVLEQEVAKLSLLAAKDFGNITAHELARELDQLVARFKKEKLLSDRQKLTEELKKAETLGQSKMVDQLMTDMTKLNQQINLLNNGN